MNPETVNIEIKRPCYNCSYTQWKHNNHIVDFIHQSCDEWFCPLFEEKLFDSVGRICALGEKRLLAPNFKCDKFIKNYLNIPEASE